MYDFLELEIGFGVSPVIFKLAKYSKRTKFIGVEIDKSCFGFFEDKLRSHVNVELVNSDIREYIKNIMSESVSKVHIYFPTPYPIDNRFINEVFVAEIYRILAMHGIVKIVTDEINYFKKIENLFDNENWLSMIWSNLPFIENDLLLVETKWEKTNKAKFHLERKKIS